MKLCSKWDPPPANTFKVNSDASIIKGVGTGVGAIVRDENGVEVCAVQRFYKEEYSIEIAEALACREGLILAQHLQLRDLIAEMDCLSLFQHIRRRKEDLSYLGHVIADILSLSISFDSLHLNCVRRTANVVAHHLAQDAFSLSVSDCFVGPVPSRLRHFVLAEAVPPV